MTIYDHTAIDRTPYTYLIGWSKLDIWYYGVSFRKGCRPSDLWTKYYTSSDYVSVHRQLYGEPDIIEIRKVFKAYERSIVWEIKCIRRMKMVKSSRWLNKREPSGNWNNTDLEIREKMKKPKKNSTNMRKPKSEKGRLGIANSNKTLELRMRRGKNSGKTRRTKNWFEKWGGKNSPKYGKILSKEERDIIRNATLIAMSCPEVKEKMKKPRIRVCCIICMKEISINWLNRHHCS